MSSISMALTALRDSSHPDAEAAQVQENAEPGEQVKEGYRSVSRLFRWDNMLSEDGMAGADDRGVQISYRWRGKTQYKTRKHYPELDMKNFS
ncbi:MAG: hypothetical protein R3B47_16830 [Bacteroidia bacterium]